MVDVILEALFDTLKAFFFILIVYFILSFLEFKIATKLSKKNKMSPFFGTLFGLIPQCGVSVIASDLYLKRHISIGTLIAVFLACSDEALPILLSSSKESALSVIPILIIKFIVGFISGFIIDLIISKKEVEQHLDVCDNKDIEVHTGCCCHHIDDEKEDWFENHIWHPFIHTLKLCGYILLINVFLGTIIYFIGEDNLSNFLLVNKYISPLLSILIGLIPNCASSVILAELYIKGSLSFGAILAGLCVNAGLGLVFLFKGKEKTKNKIYILLTLVGISLVVGYIANFIIGF